MICPLVGDSPWKHGVIPNNLFIVMVKRKGAKASLKDESAAH